MAALSASGRPAHASMTSHPSSFVFASCDAMCDVTPTPASSIQGRASGSNCRPDFFQFLTGRDWKRQSVTISCIYQGLSGTQAANPAHIRQSRVRRRWAFVWNPKGAVPPSGVSPQDLVHALDCRSAFAHRGGASFYRARAHVARGKDTRQTRLERPRQAACVRPCR